MPTAKQQKVAELIIENTKLDQPLNGGEMLEKVGYSEGLQKHPDRIISSAGVQDALEVAGFNQRSAKGVVSEIMLNPKADNASRLKATDQVFKVTGAYETDNSKSINILMPVLVKFLNEKDNGNSDGNTSGVSQTF
jgi:hypothetical protein